MDRRLLLALGVIALLIASGALVLASRPQVYVAPTTGSGEVSTQCPSNQYAYNETSSGLFICSQVSYSQLAGTPIETSSQCPVGEYTYNETTVGTLVCSQVSFAQLSGKANFQTQLNNFPTPCATYPEQFPTNVSTSLNCQLPPQFNSTGLVGYWPLTEGSGSYAYDLSGNGNTGTLVNSPAWVSSCHFSGGCLNFSSASSQYVTATTNSLPTGSASRTLVIWINPNSLTSTPAPFGYGTVSGVGTLFGFFIQSGIIHFWGNLNDFNSGMSVGTSIWSMITISYIAAQTSITVCVDMTCTTGALNGGVALATATSSNLLLSGEGGNYFNGVESQVQIFNRALSASQVSQLYNSVPYPFETQFSSQPLQWNKLTGYPSGCTGANYVDTVSTTLTCSDLGLGVPVWASASQTVSSTTLTPSTYFTFSALKNKIYTLEFSLIVNTSSTTSGIQFSITAPTNAYVAFCATYSTPVALADEFNGCVFAKSTTIGTIITGTTGAVSINAFAVVDTATLYAGSVTLNFASGTVGQSATIHAGSFFVVSSTS